MPDRAGRPPPSPGFPAQAYPAYRIVIRIFELVCVSFRIGVGFFALNILTP